MNRNEVDVKLMCCLCEYNLGFELSVSTFYTLTTKNFLSLFVSSV